MKAWLKGGLIGAGVGLVIFIVLILISFISKNNRIIEIISFDTLFHPLNFLYFVVFFVGGVVISWSLMEIKNIVRTGFLKNAIAGGIVVTLVALILALSPFLPFNPLDLIKNIFVDFPGSLPFLIILILAFLVGFVVIGAITRRITKEVKERKAAPRANFQK